MAIKFIIIVFKIDTVSNSSPNAQYFSYGPSSYFSPTFKKRENLVQCNRAKYHQCIIYCDIVVCYMITFFTNYAFITDHIMILIMLLLSLNSQHPLYPQQLYNYRLETSGNYGNFGV